jgi:hypothetical protein
MKRLFPCVLLAAVLAACSGSGPPSDAEVEAAMKARVHSSFGADEEPLVAVKTAKNRQCRPVDGGAFLCDVDVELATAGGATTTSEAELRMVRDGGQWTFDPNQALQMEAK